MGRGARTTSSAAGPTTSTSSRASTGRCRAAACTRSRCRTRTRRSGARRRRVDGHYEIGKRGIGLLSFTVGNPPEQLDERIENYRKGQADCTEPVGKFRNTTAATFTMVHCNDTNEKAQAVAEESFVWYPKAAGREIASLAD